MPRPRSGERHGIYSTEGPHGTVWHATIDIGTDPATGRRRQKRLKAPTRKQLEADIAELIGKLSRGDTVIESKRTVAEFLEEWISGQQGTLKSSSIREYRSAIDIWIAPELGGIRLTRLKPIDVQRLMTTMRERGRSGTTQEKVHGVLRVALNAAVQWGYVPKNVCALVKAPRRTTKEMQVWSAEETAKVLRTAAGDDLEALWRLALTTGMRRGELLGLRWNDVDLERKQLSIRHTLVRGEKGRWESSTPKTGKSQRTIAISTQMVAMLRAHRAKQAERQLRASQWKNTLDLVFTGVDGAPVSANGLQVRFTDLVARAKVTPIRIHDLRHTAATLSLAAGEHPKIVSERLGHANIAMTLDLYSHVSMTMQEAAAERIEAVISGAV